ncbi:MAG: flippase-like domain-containing protein [Oscillospiraceae bacterium]|jgi:uncharacterized protein (TIRG00374 family)|nr:flippase-like domain-containing protein [Oscillospiraceae bacterium]MCI1990310.1 flippase-like domain-containing protein [Oscillospiraceae bacterium]MCI2034589.1 flippase-like domain-containing protein [Oscillospiraceae bacterium]
MKKDKSRASKIFQAAMFALSVGLLVYFCVSGNNLAVLLGSLPGLNLFWLLCAAGCVVLNWMMDGMVIQSLVGHARKSGYGYRSAFRVTMVGQYFNSVTPYAVAGQPMQFVAFLRQGVPSGIAISTLVRKFLVYQTSITVFSLAVILLRFEFFRSRFQAFMALAFIGFAYQAGSVVLLLLFTYSPEFTRKLIHGVVRLLTVARIVKKPDETRRKVGDQLRFYLENNRAMKGDRKLTLRVYGYTFLQLTALFSVPFFIYKAFRNPGAPVVDMIAAQCFVTMISGYTPLPGAAGAAEGSFLVIFQMFFKEKVITQAMLLWRLLAYYSCVVVGAFFAGFGGRRKDLQAELKDGLRHAETKAEER